MGDYNFQALNPRDFQHLVQAIARKLIGPGVTAFGDGPDGARDLTFRGKMGYPSGMNPWDGYLILGCKFNQHPTGNTKKDGDWAIQQLEKDLKKFTQKRRRLLSPEYYLFVTNIGLTGVAHSGSRDRIDRLLQNYSAKLGLKGFGAWDYNDLRGFVDGDTDVRTSYGHFITAGDVLAKMMDVLKPRGADFLDTIHTFLQKELVTDTSAKLQSAGEDPDVLIPLATVFIDLPYAETAEGATLTQEDETQRSNWVIRKLLEAGSSVLRQTTQDDAGLSTMGLERLGRIRREPRFVVVGGPGQGKSTLGQYLCQIHRAALLADRPSTRLEERVGKIIKQLEHQARDLGGLPLTRRFSITVELRTFSQALVNDPKLTLFEYIRQDIGRLGNATILPEDLKTWLKQYPWLLVLDGLDEVPPSSNRKEVITQIEHFRIDASAQNADLLVVATTRPQSYSREFSGDLFQHLYLIPLTPKQALQYGRKLAEARCDEDLRRKEDLIRSLEKACKNEATARLMQSPLQVTIMATLLEDTGEPPQQRYRLFAEYYRTIYRRETRRRLLGGILSERKTDIDIIHAHAGLFLHAAAETVVKRDTETDPEETESALSDEQFRQLVRQRLHRIGVPPIRAADLLSQISDGSLQRLVFLVRPREGWVCFDIASLKEFMAAEALMSGPDEIIRARFETTGPAIFWRNVFLFAVGKCFVEREHMLDNIVSLCTGLNEERVATRILGNNLAGRAAKTVLWGSRLALDILSDGTARQYPEYELRLVKIALELVKCGDRESHARLASIYHDELYEAFHSTIADRLGQTKFSSRAGGWHLLMALSDFQVRWAMNELDTRWPDDPQEQHFLLSDHQSAIHGQWWVKKWLELAPKVRPFYGLNYINERHLYRNEKLLPDAWRRIFNFLRNPMRQALNVTNRSSWNNIFQAFRLTPVHFGPEWLDAMSTTSFSHEGWYPYLAGARFGAAPNAGNLAKELRWLATNCDEYQDANIPILPWPLAACLSFCRSKTDLIQIANEADLGKLGDIKEWQEAEKRWRNTGISDDDFRSMEDAEWPFGKAIAQRGFPFVVCTWTSRDLSTSFDLHSFLHNLRGLPGHKIRGWLASVLLHLLVQGYRHNMVRRTHISAQDFRDLVSLGTGLNWSHWFYFLEFLDGVLPSHVGADWVEVLDWIGRQGYGFMPSPDGYPWVETLVHHFCIDPAGKQGLLPIIAGTHGQTKTVISEETLKMARTWNEQSKYNAIILTLARPNLTAEKLEELVNEILSADVGSQRAWHYFQAASSISTQQAAAFALALLAKLTPNSTSLCELEQTAHGNLVEYLTKMPSNLHATEAWRKLELPDRV